MSRTYTEEEYQQAYDRGWVAGYEYGYSKAASHTDDDAEIASAALGKAIRQRDYYRSELDRLIAQIDQVWQLALREYEHWQREDQPALEALQQTRLDQPQLAQTLAYLHDVYDDAAVEGFNDLAQIRSADDLPPAGKILLMKRLTQIVQNRRLATQSQLMALAFSEHPPVICDQICRQLRSSKGAADMKWIRKLMPWLKQHGAPAKTETVMEYLELAVKRRRSTVSIGAFAYDENVTEKTVERALKLYDLIEKESKTVSPTLLKLLK